MEYFDGVELFDFLESRDRRGVDERLAVEIVTQIMQGLEKNYIMKGEKKMYIAHNDLKPENIMIKFGENGRLVVKIIDYGYASVGI